MTHRKGARRAAYRRSARRVRSRVPMLVILVLTFLRIARASTYSCRLSTAPIRYVCAANDGSGDHGWSGNGRTGLSASTLQQCEDMCATQAAQVGGGCCEGRYDSDSSGCNFRAPDLATINYSPAHADSRAVLCLTAAVAPSPPPPSLPPPPPPPPPPTDVVPMLMAASFGVTFIMLLTFVVRRYRRAVQRQKRVTQSVQAMPTPVAPPPPVAVVPVVVQAIPVQ